MDFPLVSSEQCFPYQGFFMLCPRTGFCLNFWPIYIQDTRLVYIFKFQYVVAIFSNLWFWCCNLFNFFGRLHFGQRFWRAFCPEQWLLCLNWRIWLTWCPLVSNKFKQIFKSLNVSKNARKSIKYFVRYFNGLHNGSSGCSCSKIPILR